MAASAWDLLVCYVPAMKQDHVSIVTSFNDCITRRDLQGLASLMTDDHVFIDTADQRVSGRERCVEAWRKFFASFPDYRNRFERIIITGTKAVMVGHSVCSDVRLAGPALWTARIEGERIAEWRVFEDTEANRALLAVKD